MIPDQQLQRTKTIEIGKTYFRVGHPDDGYEIFTAMSKDQTTVWPDSSYYGPIDTTPSVIDLSHFDLRKIEPKKQPDKPGVWSLTNSPDGFPDGISFISQEMFDYPTAWDDAEYRYLCDFVPPKQSPVIPPKPENVLHLMRLTEKISKNDGTVGDMQWCTKNRAGNFYIVDGDGIETGQWWTARQCERVTE